jgi:hypothetical protein
MKEGLRTRRIAEYNRPGNKVSGIMDPEAGNLGFWQDRAKSNSKIAPRARGGEMRLPSTGGDVRLRDTASAPIGFDSHPYPNAKSGSYGGTFGESVKASGRGGVTSGKSGADPRATAKADLNSKNESSYARGIRRSE